MNRPTNEIWHFTAELALEQSVDKEARLRNFSEREKRAPGGIDKDFLRHQGESGV